MPVRLASGWAKNFRCAVTSGQSVRPRRRKWQNFRFRANIAMTGFGGATIRRDFLVTSTLLRYFHRTSEARSVDAARKADRARLLFGTDQTPRRTNVFCLLGPLMAGIFCYSTRLLANTSPPVFLKRIKANLRFKTNPFKVFIRVKPT